MKQNSVKDLLVNTCLYYLYYLQKPRLSSVIPRRQLSISKLKNDNVVLVINMADLGGLQEHTPMDLSFSYFHVVSFVKNLVNK